MPPGVGYYSAGAVKIGASGDFVTAPEVSDLFSRCVARQCADVLAETGGEILELGAGTGRMAATILKTLAEIGVLPDRYAILEVSADLSDRQRTRLCNFPPSFASGWSGWTSLPEKPIRGVMLANEVLDALPVQRFVVRNGVAHELGVGLAGTEIGWQETTDDFAAATAHGPWACGAAAGRLHVRAVPSCRTVDSGCWSVPGPGGAAAVRLRAPACPLLSRSTDRWHVALLFQTACARQSIH